MTKEEKKAEQILVEEAKTELAESMKFIAAKVAQGIYAGRSNAYQNMDADSVAKRSVEVAAHIERRVLDIITH